LVSDNFCGKLIDWLRELKKLAAEVTGEDEVCKFIICSS
jgi:hypothetical protein